MVGWATGGGHGFLTGQYGMGADNIIEAVIATPRGDILTANACQNKDIFWAIRGGGGGTYGVILSMTVNVYPMPSVFMWSLDILAEDSTSGDAWWSLIAKVHTFLPQLQDRGIHGYYSISGPPASNALHFYGAFFLLNGTNATVQSGTAGLQQMLALADDTVTWSQTSSSAPTYYELIQTLPAVETVGLGGRISASRLVTLDAVATNKSLLAETLQMIGPKSMPPPVCHRLSFTLDSF